MIRPRVLAVLSILVSVLSLPGLVSFGWAETPTAAPPMEVPARGLAVPFLGFVLEGVSAPFRAIVPAGENPPESELTTLEGSEEVSLEGLRRELHRYNDQDLPNRFVEVSTERSPLFGPEE